MLLPFGDGAYDSFLEEPGAGDPVFYRPKQRAICNPASAEENSKKTVAIIGFGVYRRSRGKLNCFSKYGVLG
jgi:hypothetical protein